MSNELLAIQECLPKDLILNDQYMIDSLCAVDKFTNLYSAVSFEDNQQVIIDELYPKGIIMREMGSLDYFAIGEGYPIYLKNFQQNIEILLKVKSNSIVNIINADPCDLNCPTSYVVYSGVSGRLLTDYVHEKFFVNNIDAAKKVITDLADVFKKFIRNKVYFDGFSTDCVFMDVVDGQPVIKVRGLGDISGGRSFKTSFTPTTETKAVNILAAIFYQLLSDESLGTISDNNTSKLVNELVNKNKKVSKHLNDVIMNSLLTDSSIKSVKLFCQLLNNNNAKIPARSISLKKYLIPALFGVGILCCIGIVVTVIVMLQDSKTNSDLKAFDDTTLSVWYMSDGNSAKDEMMEAIEAEFENTYPNIDIELVAISQNDYGQALADAAINDELPDLFESSEVDPMVLDNCISLSNIVESENFQNNELLISYQDVYSDMKQMPMAIEVPMVCFFAEGAVNYTSDLISALEILPSDNPIYVDNTSWSLNSENFNLELSNVNAFDFDDYTIDKECIVTSTSQIGRLERVLETNGFIVAFNHNAVCRYTFEWSISNGKKSQIEVAEELLSLMLSDEYQTIMYTSNELGCLPIGIQSLRDFVADRPYLNPINSLYEEFSFIQYEPMLNLNEQSEKIDIDTAISELYSVLLLRNPSVEEVQYWVDMYSNNEIGMCGLINSFFNSEEFAGIERDNEALVSVLFAITHRDENYDSYQYYIQQLNDGADRHSIALQIIYSDEYYLYCEENDLVSFIPDIDDLTIVGG